MRLADFAQITLLGLVFLVIANESSSSPEQIGGQTGQSTLWWLGEGQLLIALDKMSPGTRDSRYAADHTFGNLRIGCPRSIRVLVVDGSLPILK